MSSTSYINVYNVLSDSTKYFTFGSFKLHLTVYNIEISAYVWIYK